MGRLKTIKTQAGAFWKARLPIEILETFEGADVQFIGTQKKGSPYKSINDDQVVIYTGNKLNLAIYAITTFVILLFFIFLLGISSTAGILINSIVFILFVLLTSMFFLAKSTYIVLNRISGIISFQKPLGKKAYHIPFNEMEAGWKGVGGASPEMLLIIRHKKNKKNGIVSPNSHLHNIQKTLSFYVWYMDKNRPLPPGTAFDDFREADFQRRKKEGFPSPLFKSLIPTPEATDEQQLVREAFWKDEDCIPIKKEA